jgi:type III pantothenate kinase
MIICGQPIIKAQIANSNSGIGASMTNRIAVNVGNSRIACGLFVDSKLVELKHHLVANGIAAGQSIAELARATNTEKIALCSVVPSVSSIMLEYLQQQQLELFLITAQSQKVVSDVYLSMGADRVANAAGALKLYAKKNAAVVIDFGTATTLTAVDPSGKFLGGMITLGLGQTFAALFTATEQLPDIQWEFENGLPEPLGTDTHAAITGGCILGHLGILEYWVKAVKRKLNQPCTVIATGGQANTIAPHTKIFDHVNSDLTIHGINFIAEAEEVPGDRS